MKEVINKKSVLFRGIINFFSEKYISIDIFFPCGVTKCNVKIYITHKFPLPDNTEGKNGGDVENTVIKGGRGQQQRSFHVQRYK